MKRLIYILTPLIIASGFIFIFNWFLDTKIEDLMGQKDLSYARHEMGERPRDRGTIFQNYFAEKDDLMLFGSSELGSKVPQNPVNLFPFNDVNYNLSIYGVAHIQSLQHATILGANRNIDGDSKLALVVSLQWFDQAWGISGSQFMPGFTEVQYYNFLSNSKISKKNKEYLTSRVNELVDPSMFKEEVYYAKGYNADSLYDKVIHFITKPYFKFKEYTVETKEKIEVIKDLKKLSLKNEDNIVKEIDFSKAYIEAEEQGKAAVTSNRFYAEDEYYDKYLKDIIGDLENRDININPIKSKEVEDFKFYLDVCNDLGVKPLIILMNVNGWYYDYLGIGLEKRTNFYNELESIAKEKGFDVLNLQKYEYEKYYLSDVMHLGRKGWLNVTEEMYNYFQKK